MKDDSWRCDRGLLRVVEKTRRWANPSTTFLEVWWNLSSIQPTIIYDYPVEYRPLSKAKPDDPAHVERFEFFAGGFELGNASAN